MRWPKLKTIILIGGGVLAISPLVAAHLAIAWHIRAQARSAVTDISTQMLARAETAIDQGLDALTGLAQARVSSCGPAALDAMRRAVYANYSIKEIGLTDESGRMVCNQIGDKIDVVPLSNVFPTSNGNVKMQIVGLGRSARRGLMMTWAFGEGGGLSVVMSSEAAVADILPTQMRDTSLGMMTLADGALVGTVPQLGKSPSEMRFDANTVAAKTQSGRYPIEVSVFAPLAIFWNGMGGFMRLVDFGGVAIAGVILGLVLYGLNRPRGAASDIREAMERGEFIPFYQPVVDIQNGRLMGCEVLMRRRLPDGTILPPSLFIALAEATGLALPMTRKLMETVRDDLSHSYGARPHLKLSINLFDDHFESLRVVRDVEAIFGPSNIAFGQVTLEITERQPLANIDRARVVIRRLQELGVRVALDDAGTGHGGLAYLQQLGIDVIKIDKLFVDTIDATSHPSPILDSLIKLGQELGMELIAEGVEEIEQVEYLRVRGVAAAQGYLFAPPLPTRSFIDLIEAMDPVETAKPATAEPAPAMVS